MSHEDSAHRVTTTAPRSDLFLIVLFAFIMMIPAFMALRLSLW